MTNVFWSHPSVIYAVSHRPPFHLKTVTYTRQRNVASSQHYTTDKRNKSSTQHITMSLCCRSHCAEEKTSNVTEHSLPLYFLSFLQIHSLLTIL